MKKYFSERNWVVILFITALTVFSFAQEDAKKAERHQQNSTASSLLPAASQQTSALSAPILKTENTEDQAK
jgi:hypothetical protein